MADLESMAAVLSRLFPNYPLVQEAIENPPSTYLVGLPETEVLVRQLDAERKELEAVKAGVVTRRSQARVEMLTRGIAATERKIAQAKRRDDRAKQGCRCLGTGGRGSRGETYTFVPTGYEQVAWRAESIDEEGVEVKMNGEYVFYPMDLCAEPGCEAAQAHRDRRADAEERRAAYFVRARLAKLWNDDTIPHRNQHQTFETWVRRVVNAKHGGEHLRPGAERLVAVLRAWIDAPPNEDGVQPSLILWGRKGRGKTGLTIALLRALADLGIPVLFESIDGLLQRVKDCYGPGATTTEGEILKLIYEIAVLAMDDLGSEQTTEWSQKTLSRIINHRYNRGLRTILTTNLTPRDAMVKHLGDRAADRMLENSLVLLVDGPSLRGTEQEDGTF
jgi:DNA replication protein DnaC